MPKCRYETKIKVELWYHYFLSFFVSSAETGRLVKSRCPNKVYVFNRYPNLKFIEKEGQSLVQKVLSRQECQNLCLAETQIPCLSASFQTSTSLCFLNEQTKANQPWLAEPDQDFDYMENVSQFMYK